MSNEINIAVIGLGQIGSYLLNELYNKKKDILNKTGKKINVVAVSAKNKNKKRSFKINKKIFYSNPLDIIKKNYEENNIILDPHTAVGVGAAKKLSFNDCVVLSTAHPCKFPDATNNAINKHEKLPEELQHVLNKKENFQVLKNNTEEVKKFVKSKIK